MFVPLTEVAIGRCRMWLCIEFVGLSCRSEHMGRKDVFRRTKFGLPFVIGLSSHARPSMMALTDFSRLSVQK